MYAEGGDEDMSWFGVRVLQRATHGDSPSSEDLYEESVFLVLADDAEAAAQRAGELAQEASIEYRNVYGELVTWRVDHVFDPFEIGDVEPADGLEIYSRFYYVREGREVSPAEMPD